MDQGQTFQNHGRVEPVYHIGVFGLFILNFLWSAWQMRNGITGENVMGLLLAIGLLLLFFAVRPMILRVQDRLIRLEMQLRLQKILPADLQPRVKELTVRQLIALRFASDAEMADLVREVLGGKLASGKEIKMKIKNWQGDYLRA
ncbi:MAG: hypothetical protein A3H97_00875 [Acidobacteria bacterium RIFCSPLOWO2_02_FULL_65_29]|nr:MAG: hypothetical protein A3H97_00875 [Acidobacteria bacterium RIFCSPLOWO2_02_FULL_65_29]